MARTEPLYDTDPKYVTPLRTYIIEGCLVTWVLVMAAALGCMTADYVQGKLVAKCFCPVERAAP
jgi:hypothetical protein